MKAKTNRVFTIFRLIRALIIPSTDMTYFTRDYPGAITSLRELPKSIDGASVPEWHKWGNPKTRIYDCGDNLLGLDDFAIQSIQDDFVCDITDVDGLFCSKSTLANFMSTSDMVRRNRPELLLDINEVGLDRNLAHPGIQIIRGKGIDHFKIYSWDNRIFLSNSDGSHHFSAAKLIAQDIGKKVPITAKLERYSINPVAVKNVCDHYEMFLISGTPSVENGLFKAMRNIDAPWIKKSLPWPYKKEDGFVAFLPRSNKNSMTAAKILSKLGFVGFSHHLNTLTSGN